MNAFKTYRALGYTHLHISIYVHIGINNKWKKRHAFNYNSFDIIFQMSYGPSIVKFVTLFIQC